MQTTLHQDDPQLIPLMHKFDSFTSPLANSLQSSTSLCTIFLEPVFHLVSTRYSFLLSYDQKANASSLWNYFDRIDEEMTFCLTDSCKTKI